MSGVDPSLGRIVDRVRAARPKPGEVERIRAEVMPRFGDLGERVWDDIVAAGDRLWAVEVARADLADRLQEARAALDEVQRAVGVLLDYGDRALLVDRRGDDVQAALQQARIAVAAVTALAPPRGHVRYGGA